MFFFSSPVADRVHLVLRITHHPARQALVPLLDAVDAAVAASAAAASSAAFVNSSFQFSPLPTFHSDGFLESEDDESEDAQQPLGPRQHGAIAAELARVAGALPDPQQAAAALRALLRAPGERLLQGLEHARVAAAFAASPEAPPAERAAAQGEAEKSLLAAAGELRALGAIVGCGADVAMRSGAVLDLLDRFSSCRISRSFYSQGGVANVHRRPDRHPRWLQRSGRCDVGRARLGGGRGLGREAHHSCGGRLGGVRRRRCLVPQVGRRRNHSTRCAAEWLL